jgi:hypothetical protein
MTLINFKLRHPDNVTPWGTPPGGSMHWFGLTESEYWLQLGKATLYEYTEDVLRHWDVSDFKCVEYQSVRLIEDWTSIFESIVEPIPDEFYEIAKNHKSLYDFYERATQWLDKVSDDPSIDVDTYYDKYDQVIEWIYSRTLNAIHLTYGPSISFFRNKEVLSIVWEASHRTEENIPVWTAQAGEVEMKYTDMVSEMEEFGERFFSAMQHQVEIAVDKDWGAVELNKSRLVEEQQERKAEFAESVSLLTNKPRKSTNWDLVGSLIKEMNS